MEKRIRESLAVLLTVHNRVAVTTRCLMHLFEQELPPTMHMDVYMVDDGSTDGTAQAVKDQFPQVNIIQGDGSLYWNRGMWTAWDVASKNKSYDFYLWLNDDTFLLDNAITQLLDLSGQYDNEIIVVGASKIPNSDKLTYGGHTDTGRPICNGIPNEITIFNGNIVLVPRKVFEKLGNLDYYYRHGMGDYDYAIRARKAGIKMYQCGNALGICDVHKRIDKWCNPDVPFPQRLKAMHQPTGMPPKEWFHYESQISVPKALFHVITLYVRCAFPALWEKQMKEWTE